MKEIVNRFFLQCFIGKMYTDSTKNNAVITPFWMSGFVRFRPIKSLYIRGYIQAIA